MRIFSSVILVMCCLAGMSQGPTFNTSNTDWYITGGSLLLAGGSTFSRYNAESYTPQTLPSFDRMNVNSFDRVSTFYWSPQASKASDLLALAAPALPAIILLDAKSREERLALFHIYAQSSLITLALTDYTKTLVKRDRPFLYNENAPESERFGHTARLSFFSGHTSMTSNFCFMTAKLFSEMNPDSKAKPLVWTGAALYPAVVGYLRVRAGKHFPTDVIVGYLVGALVGYLVPHLHSHNRNFR